MHDQISEQAAHLVQLADQGNLAEVWGIIEEILSNKPHLALSHIIQEFDRRSHLLEHRRLMYPAALDPKTLALLIQNWQSHISVVNHPPVISAEEKLYLGSLPLKTVTVRWGSRSEHTLLVSWVTDGSKNNTFLPRSWLRKLGASALALSRKITQDVSVNPIDLCAHAHYHLLEGIVSPFLPPGRTYAHAGVILIEPESSLRREWMPFNVPASTHESLELPIPLFLSAVMKHHTTFHPDMLLGVQTINGTLSLSRNGRTLSNSGLLHPHIEEAKGE